MNRACIFLKQEHILFRDLCPSLNVCAIVFQSGFNPLHSMVPVWIPLATERQEQDEPALSKHNTSPQQTIDSRSMILSPHPCPRWIKRGLIVSAIKLCKRWGFRAYVWLSNSIGATQIASMFGKVGAYDWICPGCQSNTTTCQDQHRAYCLYQERQGAMGINGTWWLCFLLNPGIDLQLPSTFVTMGWILL